MASLWDYLGSHTSKVGQSMYDSLDEMLGDPEKAAQVMDLVQTHPLFKLISSADDLRRGGMDVLRHLRQESEQTASNSPNDANVRFFWELLTDPLRDNVNYVPRIPAQARFP